MRTGAAARTSRAWVPRRAAEAAQGAPAGAAEEVVHHVLYGSRSVVKLRAHGGVPAPACRRRSGWCGRRRHCCAAAARRHRRHLRRRAARARPPAARRAPRRAGARAAATAARAARRRTSRPLLRASSSGRRVPMTLNGMLSADRAGYMVGQVSLPGARPCCGAGRGAPFLSAANNDNADCPLALAPVSTSRKWAHFLPPLLGATPRPAWRCPRRGGPW